MAPPAEISIPTTSLHTPADGSKPHTLYNITLRLPLRSYVVQKRYSDFAALHKSLASHVGAPPPAPLPGKTWFKSTVSSAALTEQRRVALEKYLRAVAEPPDRRWRDTPAWRSFLNLPGSTNNSAASASGIGPGDAKVAAASSSSLRGGAVGPRDAVLAAASDPGTWLDLHRELRDALQEARKALARRDMAAEPGARAEAGAAAKRHLVRAGALLGALADGLRVLREAARLGEGELRRRKDLLAAARTDRDGLDKIAASLAAGPGASARQGMPSATDTAALLGSGSGDGSGSRGGPRAGGRVLGAPLPETERTRALDNQGVVQLQKQMMEEQDQSVALLAAAVRRQKELGLEIGQEVEEHIRQLDRMDDDVTRVNQKVRVAKDRTRKLAK